MIRLGLWRALVLVFALALAGLSVWQLTAAARGVAVEALRIGDTPARIYRPEGAALGPVVVIAHGFAGSQQLMQSFALTVARNGYVAVTFDFLGHGTNPAPLGGSITEEAGATERLVAQLAAVVAAAEPLGDGRVALLGHSMASDIVVRLAQAMPDRVAATIAVSMFSPVVTADSPRNLLVVTGAWEGTLRREALRAVGLATGPAAAAEGVTYGDPAKGTGRRAAVAPHVEHVGVLFSAVTMAEMTGWLDATFAVTRAEAPGIAARGPWIMALLAAAVALGWPLARALPRVVSGGRAGAGLGWRRLWLPLLVPMIATPLVLLVVPTRFLPVLVGDYLAVHFAAYGLITAACVALVRRDDPPRPGVAVSWPAFVAAALGVAGFGLLAIVWPIEHHLTAFLPGPGRGLLTVAMVTGTVAWFLADEWMTRGPGTARGGYAASKLAFLVSLGLAVALDFERLFFLVIILPVILLAFVLYGLFSRWTYGRTGHPGVAGLANGFAFGWAVAVTFPLLAG